MLFMNIELGLLLIFKSSLLLFAISASVMKTGTYGHFIDNYWAFSSHIQGRYYRLGTFSNFLCLLDIYLFQESSFDSCKVKMFDSSFY